MDGFFISVQTVLTTAGPKPGLTCIKPCFGIITVYVGDLLKGNCCLLKTTTIQQSYSFIKLFIYLRSKRYIRT